MLTKQAIEEFQQIYLKTNGEELSLADATEVANQLIRLYKVVLGNPSEHQEDLSRE